jgi:hypothetical protein
MEFSTESEGENATTRGTSKFKMKTDGIKVNEGVEFKWLSVKK